MICQNSKIIFFSYFQINSWTGSPKRILCVSFSITNPVTMDFVVKTQWLIPFHWIFLHTVLFVHSFEGQNVTSWLFCLSPAFLCWVFLLGLKCSFSYTSKGVFLYYSSGHQHLFCVQSVHHLAIMEIVNLPQYFTIAPKGDIFWHCRVVIETGIFFHLSYVYTYEHLT